MDGLPGRWHSRLMQERDLYRRLGMVVLLAQALTLHGLSGAWAKAAGAAASHASAGGYLCAFLDGAGSPQTDPADESTGFHFDCPFMCAATCGPAAATANSSWVPLTHGSFTNKVLNYHVVPIESDERGATFPRGPPTAV